MAEPQEPFTKDQLERIAAYLEKANFGEYVQLLQRPYRLILLNFLGGLSRGVGIGIGFVILAALLVYILQKLALLNLPIVGRFIADLVQIVKAQLHTPTI